MKLIIISPIFLLLTTVVFGQQAALNTFNEQRVKTSNTGLKVLGAWSAANIIYGAIAAQNAEGSSKYFHEMNAIFNGVTLGISALGYFTTKKEGALSLAESIKKQHGVEKLFLFNAGLDLAYIAGGAYIQEKGKTSEKNSLRYNGYGRSIMIQGGALFLFDGIMYAVHNKHGKKLDEMTSKISLGTTANGIGLVVKL